MGLSLYLDFRDMGLSLYLDVVGCGFEYGFCFFGGGECLFKIGFCLGGGVGFDFLGNYFFLREFKKKSLGGFCGETLLIFV